MLLVMGADGQESLNAAVLVLKLTDDRVPDELDCVIESHESKQLKSIGIVNVSFTKGQSSQQSPYDLHSLADIARVSSR